MDSIASSNPTAAKGPLATAPRRAPAPSSGLAAEQHMADETGSVGSRFSSRYDEDLEMGSPSPGRAYRASRGASGPGGRNSARRASRSVGSHGHYYGESDEEDSYMDEEVRYMLSYIYIYIYWVAGPSVYPSITTPTPHHTPPFKHHTGGLPPARERRPALLPPRARGGGPRRARRRDGGVGRLQAPERERAEAAAAGGGAGAGAGVLRGAEDLRQGVWVRGCIGVGGPRPL